jgi:hypothetical protein
MRKFLFLVLLFSFVKSIKAQEDVKKQLNGIFSRLDRSIADSLTIEGLKEVFSDPDLLNDLFAKNLEMLKVPSPNGYKYIKDLNLKFKSFQNDTLPVSLGFEYKYDNSWIKNRVQKNSVFYQTYSLSFNGNVAFRKRYNPNDFLESTLSYDGSFMFGGRAMKIDNATSDVIQEIEDTILERRSRREPYMDLYRKVNSLIRVTDQFYIGVKGKLAFESNQDFSKRQYVPGILLGMGAKGWNKNEALRYFNVLDYPFALIRLITGTDDKFTIYGSTFPSFLFGLDYVIPDKDTLRQKLIDDLDPFSRLRFEVGFKTRVARIGKEMIHFASNFRWYKELGAEKIIRDNRLEHFTYFVGALESNSGLFVSYTTGKLPFDLRNNQVYAIGFRYDLGDFKK